MPQFLIDTPPRAPAGIRSCAASSAVKQVTTRAPLVLRRWWDAEGTALSEVLYGFIGELPQPEFKPVLVALRRAVFTGRRPGSRA